MMHCEGSCDNIPLCGMREISTFIPGVKDILERRHIDAPPLSPHFTNWA